MNDGVMKKRSPDRKVKAEVARLAARPDADVNLEDIPEIRDWSGAVRGRFFRPVKQSISLRVDRDVLTWFKSFGPGYQSRMNSALRDCMDRARATPGLRRGKRTQNVMRTLTVRLPSELAQEIEAEARAGQLSKSDVVHRRLERKPPRSVREPPSFFDLAADLIGSVADDGLPADLSARKKHYLRERGYGKDLRRR